MSKNKKHQTTTDKITEAAKRSGFLLMAGAATLGMLEFPDQPDKRAIMPQQPALAMAVNNGQEPGQAANQMRREREEVAPHYMSYSVAQRTQSRSGGPGGQ